MLSKTYLHGIFSGDGDGDGEVDEDYLWEPSPIIPQSEHAPDAFTTDAAVAEIPNSPDLLFINLGDVDRSGHVDPSGPADPLARESVLSDTDTQVGRIVTALQDAGTWDQTVMFVVSDHSMDWSTFNDYVSLDDAYSADPRTAGRYAVVTNGGADNVYLKRNVKHPKKVRKALYSVAATTAGVGSVWYRHRNRADHHHGRVMPKAWGLRMRRVGDLVAFADQGFRFSDPSETSNPIPGNHGHPITRRSVALVTGGAPIVIPQEIAASDPEAIDPISDPVVLTEQSEQPDIGVTVAWLLGIKDPGSARRPQFQGRRPRGVSARPAPSC